MFTLDGSDRPDAPIHGAFVAGCTLKGAEVMRSWYLVMHNLDGPRLARAQSRLDNLGVEVYSPIHTELKKRKDCNAFRPVEKPLFPGYMFLNFDPEEIHTTTIADMHGMKGFVRFGTKLAQPSDTLIAALRQSLLLRIDKGVSCLEFRNLPEKIRNELYEIAELPTRVGREVALLCLLQKMTVVVDNLSYVPIVSNA
jgi:transcriptional antiterminator RfaH